MTSPLLGIDTGGTFTDGVSADGRSVKVPSDREDPARAVAAAADGLVADGPREVRHGSTVATNAVLEGRLPAVGLIVNRGFRDLLFIRRQERPFLYALEPRRAPIPVPEGLVAEVRGRLLADGSEREPLDPQEVERAGRRLKRGGAGALAVVLLHAWADARHEREAGAALAGCGLPVTLSSDLSPEFREVERGLAAVMNAGLQPLVGAYLDRLQSRLGKRTRVSVMTSEGGLVPPGEIAREPARLLLSGPAGGLVAARRFGEAVGERALLTLDMGGTSTDVASVVGDLPRRPSLVVAGLEIRLPCLDLHTVGAGGGSIARRDEGGALAVGPTSAGADPGPACYGRGGPLTVTDANLLLGRIAPELFAGGPGALDPGAAEKAARGLARRLGLTALDLCRGILKLADLQMLRALRVISLERGRDPRDDALVAFGGAGGLHAVSLARLMGVRRVIVPPGAGVLSARGLLWAQPSRSASRSVLRDSVPSSAERRRLGAPLREMVSRALRAAGHAARDLDLAAHLALRYGGQSFELEVPDTGDPVAAFHALHERRFGFRDPGRSVELVGLRVVGSARIQLPDLPRVGRRRRRPTEADGRVRSVLGRRESLPFHDAAILRAGDRVDGPAVIGDRTASVWLDPGSRARVHATGSLLIEVK